MSNRLRVSLVIPAYNEESHLADCLEAALTQRVPFAEIIVVDNNSTDDTALIAASFPDVTVITESKQGVVHARNRGFAAAGGDVTARIDADTVLPADWTQILAQILTDPSIAAVSGRMEYYDMAAAGLVNRVDLFFRRYFAQVLGREVALQGSNMAVRREAWQAVSQDVCALRGLHEDFDIAIHMNWADNKVVFDERLVAAIGYRQADVPFRDYCRYALTSPRTYRSHGLKSARYMYPVVGLAIICYGLLKLLHRGFDPTTQKFSLEKLLSSPAAMRVNPATFVD